MTVVLPYLRRLLLRETARASDLPQVQDGLAGVALFPVDDGPHWSPIVPSTYRQWPSTTGFRSPLGLESVDAVDRLHDMFRDVRRASRERDATGERAASSVRLRSNERGVFTFEREPSMRRGVRIWSVVIRHKIPARARLMYLPEVDAARRMRQHQRVACVALRTPLYSLAR